MPFKWGGREHEEEEPEELKGKTPAQIAQELKEARELKGKLEASEAKVGELTSKFETFGQDLDSKLDSRFAALRESFAPKKQEERKDMADFLTDPDRAFAERSAPITALTLSTAGYVAKDQAKAKLQRLQRQAPGKNFDGYFFEKYEDEIANLARTVPAGQLAQPETWEHMYYMVKGRHAEEIHAQLNDGSIANAIESGGAGARASGFESKDKDDKPTEQEARIAGKFGIKPEDYMKRKKEMDGIGITI